MLEIGLILNKIEQAHYWDSRITGIFCSNLLDEVHIGHEENHVYKFLKCYHIDFLHDLKYAKFPFLDYTNLSFAQMPYFIHNIVLKEIKIGDDEFYDFEMEAYPLTLNIICKEIIICTYRESSYKFIEKSN